MKKYKRTISPMIPGRGILMEVDDNKINYIHWDVPDEFFDRLRLFLASVLAGHTDDTKEVNSIFNELR